ncbi:MAG: IMP cyclohydrolase [Patescibacteria group bacterium]|jgi:hypothetical protein
MSDRVKLLNEEAERNFRRLKGNPYWGRGVIEGVAPIGRYSMSLYFVMGRSDNSRNRILVADGQGNVRTRVADPRKVTDPSLIIYRAMGGQSDLYVVSNGEQTDGVLRADAAGYHWSDGLRAYGYEPDAPNFTSRITGVTNLRGGDGDPIVSLSILRCSPFNSTCDQELYTYRGLAPGFGRCITTYSGDGSPLPPFDEKPLLVPINSADTEEVAKSYWGQLDEENRVSLVVRRIDLVTGDRLFHVINQYKRVAQD